MTQEAKGALPVFEDLVGKTALVTGASSGLGWRFAQVLALAGAKVAIAARRLERLSELERQIEAHDGRALPLVMDVTDPNSIEEGLRTAATELGPIEILVNNAGVADAKPALEMSEQDWDWVLDTNLKGAWLVARATAEQMAQHGHGGSIINVTSVLGDRGQGSLVAYCAAKAGLANATRVMALEWARHKIRVNALAPGYVETDINRSFLKSEAGQKLIKGIPQRRVGQPDDLDGPLLLLSSNAGRYMTGSTLYVDGGLLSGL